MLHRYVAEPVAVYDFYTRQQTSRKLTPVSPSSLLGVCVQKITAKNTWDLHLIDHISDIVKDSKEENEQTNFQKVSTSHLRRPLTHVRW